MAKRLIWTNPDGSMSSFNPAPEAMAEAAQTEDEFLADDAVRARVVPAGATDLQVVEKTALPTDRTYRDAWENSGGTVTVNMTKARAIHADRLAVQIAEEDAAYEKSRKQEQLEGRGDPGVKPARNLTQLATDIASATTPDELKAVTLK